MEDKMETSQNIMSKTIQTISSIESKLQNYKCNKCGLDFKSSNLYLDKLNGEFVLCGSCKPPIDLSISTDKEFFDKPSFDPVKHKADELRKLILSVIPLKFVDIEYPDETITKRLFESEKSLFIHGKVGVMKTTLMCSICKELLKLGSLRVEDDSGKYAESYYINRVVWINYVNFIIKLQGMFRDKEKDPYDYASRVAKFKGTLAIDDLGVEKDTEFVNQITYYIINYREQNLLRTIITSNKDLKVLGKEDSRIASRIAGMCKIIELTGKDNRIKEI